VRQRGRLARGSGGGALDELRAVQEVRREGEYPKQEVPVCVNGARGFGFGHHFAPQAGPRDPREQITARRRQIGATSEEGLREAARDVLDLAQRNVTVGTLQA